MSQMYNDRSPIIFSSISSKYAVPKQYKAKLSELHSIVIEYVTSNFRNTRAYKQKVCDALNVLTYCILENEMPGYSWSQYDPLGTLPDYDMDVVQSVLDTIYLTPEGIEWDVEPTSNAAEEDAPVARPADTKKANTSKSKPASKPAVKAPKNNSEFDNIPDEISVVYSEPKVKVPKLVEIPQEISNTQVNNFDVARSIKASSNLPARHETDKVDLYIQPRVFNAFDGTRPWLVPDRRLNLPTIFVSLPEIPKVQRDITVTTNPDIISDSEYMQLYPTRFIRTRQAVMYDRVEGMSYDEDLGCIFPIEGFTEKEVIDNIIRYPHIYKLKRYINGQFIPFYQDIEIDGKLMPIDDIWDSLPESKVIPRHKEFVKEYIVRRYLLERDKGIDHQYKLYGGLDPFLTLFMPSSDYSARGYTDTLEIVKQCVRSRISYLQTRNPIIRRIQEVNG